MPELPPILLSALTGFLSGMLLSIPVGPVNLTIINEGTRRGFLRALLVGLGAATMDVIYCTIAFTGFSSFFKIRIIKTLMEVFTFVFMLFLGVKFLLAKTVTAPTELGAAASRIEERIGEKLHPHSAFMTGFVRVLGNLGVLLFWIVAAAYFMSHEPYFTSYEWVEDTIAAKAQKTFVIANNHFEGKAAVNALQLKHMLSKQRGKATETLLRHYPELKSIADPIAEEASDSNLSLLA